MKNRFKIKIVCDMAGNAAHAKREMRALFGDFSGKHIKSSCNNCTVIKKVKNNKLKTKNYLDDFVHADGGIVVMRETDPEEIKKWDCWRLKTTGVVTTKHTEDEVLELFGVLWQTKFINETHSIEISKIPENNKLDFGSSIGEEEDEE